MLDIGFSELAAIGVVALIVVGPKQLPTVARVAGKMFGQFNRYVSQIKRDVRDEMEKAELAELRKEFEESSESVKTAFQENIQDELLEAENHVQSAVSDFDIHQAHNNSKTTSSAQKKPFNKL